MSSSIDSNSRRILSFHSHRWASFFRAKRRFRFRTSRRPRTSCPNDLEEFQQYRRNTGQVPGGPECHASPSSPHSAVHNRLPERGPGVRGFASRSGHSRDVPIASIVNGFSSDGEPDGRRTTDINGGCHALLPRSRLSSRVKLSAGRPELASQILDWARTLLWIVARSKSAKSEILKIAKTRNHQSGNL